MRRPSESPFSFFFFFFFWFVANLSVCCVCAVKKRPKLKSRCKRRVESATKYTKTIDHFDDLVDQRTLARHCLSLELSPFVLRAIEIEEKSKCLFHIVIALNFPFFFFLFLTSVSLS